MLTVLIAALMQMSEPATPAPAEPPPAQTASAAQTPTQASPQAPAPATSADNVMRCRYVVATGTRIPTRWCSTPAQDRQRALEDQERLRHIERQGDLITPSHDH